MVITPNAGCLIEVLTIVHGQVPAQQSSVLLNRVPLPGLPSAENLTESINVTLWIQADSNKYVKTDMVLLDTTIYTVKDMTYLDCKMSNVSSRTFGKPYKLVITGVRN